MSSITIEDTGFVYHVFQSKDEFDKTYPRPVRGQYIPQPDFPPDAYPVLAIEASFKHVDNGPDEYVMFYSYDFEVND